MTRTTRYGLLLLALAPLGCQDEIGYVDPVAEADYEVHDREYLDGKPHGLWRYYYASGELWREVELKAGIRDGLERVYYPKGTLRQEGRWRQDLRDGAWTSFDENGNRCAESSMVQGTGTYRHCYANGQLSEESEQQRGVLHGLTTQYFSDGSLSSSYNYDQGVRHGPFIESDGIVRTAGEYDRDRLNGLVTGTYVASGVAASRGTYTLGLPTGLHEAWYPSGQLEYSDTYDNQGRRDGVSVSYYADGQLEQRASFQAGLHQGPFESYYADGKPWTIGAYERDLQVGLWEFYREGGMPDSFVEFELGQNIGLSVDYDSDGLSSILNFDWSSSAHDETWVQGMGLKLNGGELTQLCRYHDNSVTGCLTLPSGREGSEPQRLTGSWRLTQQNGSPAADQETLSIQTDGKGQTQFNGLSLPFSYQTKGPLFVRRLGTSSELDAFFVDGSTLYLFRRENYWQYERAL